MVACLKTFFFVKLRPSASYSPGRDTSPLTSTSVIRYARTLISLVPPATQMTRLVNYPPVARPPSRGTGTSLTSAAPTTPPTLRTSSCVCRRRSSMSEAASPYRRAKPTSALASELLRMLTMRQARGRVEEQERHPRAVAGRPPLHSDETVGLSNDL